MHYLPFLFLPATASLHFSFTQSLSLTPLLFLVLLFNTTLEICVRSKIINIYLWMSWSASSKFTLNLVFSLPSCVDATHTTQNITLSVWFLITMNIYCHRLLVVFCEETQDNIDIRGLERLIDKRVQLMYLMNIHAKLNKGQCGLMTALEFSVPICNTLICCHTFIPSLSYSGSLSLVAQLQWHLITSHSNFTLKVCIKAFLTAS